MDARSRVAQYTDLELADVIRTIVRGMTHREIRRCFPAVTANDLSRVGRTTHSLSTRKRRGWEEIAVAWEEAGRPDGPTLAQEIGKPLVGRVEVVFKLVAHREWAVAGVPLEVRLQVGERILRGEEASAEELQEFRNLAQAALLGRANAEP